MPERSRGAYLFTEFLEQGGRGRGFSRGVVEQAGDHGENGGVVAQREPAFLRNAGEQGVEFVEGRGGERAVGGVDAADPGEFIVEHQTKGAAAADDGKTVRRLGGNHKEVAGAGGVPAAADGLHPFAGEVEDELGEVVAMRRDLDLTVAVELELAQDKTQRVNRDFLDKQRTPGEQGVGCVLAQVGIVLTQAGALA